MADRMTDVAGEVDGREYAEWVRRSVVRAAVNRPRASYSKSGGWLALYDTDRDRVFVYRLVDQHDVDDPDPEPVQGDGGDG